MSALVQLAGLGLALLVVVGEARPSSGRVEPSSAPRCVSATRLAHPGARARLGPLVVSGFSNGRSAEIVRPPGRVGVAISSERRTLPGRTIGLRGVRCNGRGILRFRVIASNRQPTVPHHLLSRPFPSAKLDGRYRYYAIFVFADRTGLWRLSGFTAGGRLVGSIVLRVVVER